MITKTKVGNQEIIDRRVMDVLRLAILITLFIMTLSAGIAKADDYSNNNGQVRLKTWNRLTSHERKIYKERLKKWQELDPSKRKRIFDNYRRYRNMSTEERRDIKENWQRWRQFGPEKRRAVRDRYREMRERGPGLGGMQGEDEDGRPLSREEPGQGPGLRLRREVPPEHGAGPGNEPGGREGGQYRSPSTRGMRPMRRPGGGPGRRR